MAVLARRLLADPAIPHASAAMQFLASYPWLDGWRRGDVETIAAIIRDQRVTDFPGVRGLEKDRETPPELARPIIERIMGTDLSGSPSRKEHGQHYAVRILAEIFSLLPTGAAAASYGDLQRLAEDQTRRPYAAAMFSRLADAGPSALGDLELMIRNGLQEGHAAENKTGWALGDGCIPATALYGLARLGTAAKPAVMTALNAVKDDLGDAYCGNELRNAGYLALLHMGEIEALKTVRSAGFDYLLKQLDKDAAWEIGACGAIFPHSPIECQRAKSR